MAEKSLNLKQTRFLQPLRSNTVHTTVKAAIEDIQAIQSSLSGTSHSDGISVVARYKDENGVGKSVLGIYSYVTNSFTYFVHDSEAIEKIIKRVGSLEEAVGEGGSVATQIANAIKELDVETIGGEGKIVTSVSETDGKISATFIDATASNIAVKDDSNLFAADNVEGVLTEIETALNQEISERTEADNALDGRLDVIEGEGEGSIKKAVADAKSELLGDAAEEYNTLGKLEDKIQEAVTDAKSYSIAKVEGDELTALGENVKEAWKLVDEDGTQSGATISIYKDSSLKEVKLEGQELQFTYILANGSESTVGVDVSNFLAEEEFANGLQVVDHVVSVKLAEGNESFLTVDANGVKLSGVQNAIDNAIDALDYTLAKEEGKAIVGVSQTDGIIAAEYGNIAASSVTVSAIEGITATTVQDTLAELEGEIAALDDAAVKSINVNGVEGSFANGAASVTIEGDDIVVSSGYGDAVTYPTLSNTAVTFTAVDGSDKVDAAIKKLDQNVATLVQEVLNNEEVTAAALTKHNESCGFNENAEYVANTAATYINNASNLVEADNLLDAAISNLQTQIDNVSDAAISVVSGNGISITGESTEKTIAAVANENDSLITVTENGIGIKDDGYIDCGTF